MNKRVNFRQMNFEHAIVLTHKSTGRIFRYIKKAGYFSLPFHLKIILFTFRMENFLRLFSSFL